MVRGYLLLLPIVALIWSDVFADDKLEFQHIRLNPEFVSEVQGRSRMGSKSLHESQPHWRSRLVPILFDNEVAELNVQSGTAQKSMRSEGPWEGQDSQLYFQIQGWLGNQYQGIGAQQANQVNHYNSMFNLGTQNFSGFSWQKPFGGFTLNVDRQLSPELGSDKWVVMDTFTIEIEASTFLGKLGEGGVVNMTDSEIAAFAGIKLKRIYTTYHYANSFMEGLIIDYTSLFLPFLAHSPSRVLQMKPGELMKREDQWTMGAGGLIESPPFYGLSFHAGVLAEMSYQSIITMQAIDKASQVKPGEFLRVSHHSAQRKSAGVSAGLQLDFFKILQLTLLSYDLSYSAEKNKEFNLSFTENDRVALATNADLGREFAGLLRKNSPEIRYLEPYVVMLKEGEENESTSRAMLLLWGNLKKSALEKTRIIKDQIVKEYFTHHSESIRMVQNFWSRLFSSLIFRIFKFNSYVYNEAAFSRKLAMEYEATLPQSPDPEKMWIENTEQFSMNLSLSYEAARTDRWSDKSYKKDMENFLLRYTTLPANYRTMLRNEELVGPTLATMSAKVMGDGLAHFNALAESEVRSVFSDVCNEDKDCITELMTPYQQYKKVWTDMQRLELVQLKKLMGLFSKKLKSLEPLRGLFGDYVFIHGTFRAASRAGMNFSTTFSSGQFRGVGVIDTFRRLNGTRTPATVGGE
mgnify:CR=1 FL=1